MPLEHFACFACRKAFKRPDAWTYVVRAEARLHRHAARAVDFVPPRCPDCRRPMIGLGRNFRAPRRLDAKGWTRVRILAEHGIRFSNLGTGLPPIPRRAAELIPFLRAHRDRTVGERLALRFRTR